ncbi:MAG: hypothetical protein K0S29_525 [Gammaproteobacteria bacterium]|jgi:uncharacterized membrane protein YfcA|nr:hypothetical protein [Gammaproteobacteria bacterium]
MIFGLYVLVGMLSGFLSGLLGIGGGLVIVPCLVFIFSHFDVIASKQLMHLVLGTSLANSVVNLIVSSREHHKHQAIRWPVFLAMAPGGIIGGLILGPSLVLVLKSHYLQIIFGVFCLLIGLYMLKAPKKAQLQERMPGKYILSLYALVAGSLSTMLGIAGGVMIGSILNYHQMDPRKVVGTTAITGLIIALPGTIGLMLVGLHQPGLPHWSTGYIYWPAFLGIVLPSFFMAPLGAKLAHNLPVQTLKRIFAALVFVVGLKMLI